MKMDGNEIRTVASVEAVAPRVDLYAGIHKAMRALMADLLVAVGRIDVHDRDEVRHITQRVEEFADFCTAHLTHENTFVHVAMEARQPGSSVGIANEHVVHEAAIRALRSAALVLTSCPDAERDKAALALYRQLALFIAENFEHMQLEETVNNQILWTHYSDAELIDLHARLVASLSPEENFFVLRWMIPAMTPAERVQVLDDMRSHVPQAVFETVLDMLQKHLNHAAWAKLARGLGIAPVPGLVEA